MGTKEPRHFKDEMDEMAKIIKYLSNKISRMELDQANPDPYIMK
jgi:hypothetical protein